MTDLMLFMFEEAWRDEPYTYLNPWGEPLMIAGHGTIGVEIFEDLPTLDSVFVPVGGGALIAGVASVLKTLKASVRVFAVQAAVNSALAAALATPVAERGLSVCVVSGGSVDRSLFARVVGQIGD